MPFLKYSDLPVFAEFTSQNTAPSKDVSKIFMATEASLSLDTNLTANRYLGKTQVRNDFSLTGPLEGKFSMSFVPIIEYGTSVTNIQKENQTIDLEQFISVKGIKALGNQLTIDKLKQINLLESLPYDEPEEIAPEEMEVSDESNLSDDIQTELDEDGQITLSLE